MRSIVLALLFVWSSAASAIEPVDDARTKALFTQLRCVVCQNQSIADSDAAVAADLRTIVRTKIDEGETDAAILDYLVARYGEFVLLRPRLQWNTVVLWAAPALVLIFGLLAMYGARRRDDKPGTAGLTVEEERRLKALLDNHTNG